MKKLLLLSCFYFSIVIGYGQTKLVAQFDKGVKYLQSSNFSKAKEIFTEVYTQSSDLELKKMCLIYRGFSYNGLGDFQSAITDFDSVIAIDPIDLATYIDRGESKFSQGNFTGAKSDFQYVLSKDKNKKLVPSALYYLSKIAVEEKDYKKAIGYLTELIPLKTDSKELSELYFERGYVKGLIKDIEGSIFDYNNAIAINPKYKEAIANRGVAKINLLTSNGNINPTEKESSDACSDLKQAYQLGDKSVKDLISIYCK